jgi:hypothetical protein
MARGKSQKAKKRLEPKRKRKNPMFGGDNRDLEVLAVGSLGRFLLEAIGVRPFEALIVVPKYAQEKLPDDAGDSPEGAVGPVN